MSPQVAEPGGFCYAHGMTNRKQYEIEIDHNGDLHVYHTQCHAFVVVLNDNTPLSLDDIDQAVAEHEAYHAAKAAKAPKALRYGVFEAKDGRGFCVWDRKEHRSVSFNYSNESDALNEAVSMNDLDRSEN